MEMNGAGGGGKFQSFFTYCEYKRDRERWHLKLTKREIPSIFYAIDGWDECRRSFVTQ
jgi:hypothetical protein